MRPQFCLVLPSNWPPLCSPHCPVCFPVLNVECFAILPKTVLAVWEKQRPNNETSLSSLIDARQPPSQIRLLSAGWDTFISQWLRLFFSCRSSSVALRVNMQHTEVAVMMFIVKREISSLFRTRADATDHVYQKIKRDLFRSLQLNIFWLDPPEETGQFE